MAYVPILKGKAGEFLALGHASAEVQAQLRPVIENVPDLELRNLLETFCEHAMENVPDGMVLTVDCGALPPDRVRKGDVGGPIARVGESLGLRGVGRGHDSASLTALRLIKTHCRDLPAAR